MYLIVLVDLTSLTSLKLNGCSQLSQAMFRAVRGEYMVPRPSAWSHDKSHACHMISRV